MSQEVKNDGAVGGKQIAINIAIAIGAIVVGRLVGFLGIGAGFVGWYVYKNVSNQQDKTVGIIVGIVAALASYGLAVIGLAAIL